MKAVESQQWDPSVQSLAAFPKVLATMDAKPDRVQSLGETFLVQPEDVMDSVQRLRQQVYKAGNLMESKEQKVVIQEAVCPPATTNRWRETAGPGQPWATSMAGRSEPALSFRTQKRSAATTRFPSSSGSTNSKQKTGLR